MSTAEAGAGQFNDCAEVVSAGPGAGGLVLPAGVVADLAGQLVARARAGEPVRLTGRDGLLAGVIGQVLRLGWRWSWRSIWRRAASRTGGTGTGPGR